MTQAASAACSAEKRSASVRFVTGHWRVAAARAFQDPLRLRNIGTLARSRKYSSVRVFNPDT
jgi:hypothetical protein